MTTSHLIEINHLEALRISELKRVFSEVKVKNPNETFILEIGAGTGRQAREMAEYGYHVEAIDLASSNYSPHRSWPIIDYDGKNIPFPDNHFDIVFSSNVLEHMTQVVKFQDEIMRVLKPDGIAIHIVPSSCWRLWTNVAFYPFIFKRALNILYSKTISKMTFWRYKEVPCNETIKAKSVSRKVSNRIAFFPQRHGENGNAFSELYYFSRYYWSALFKNTGWNIRKRFTTGLAYTGYSIFGTLIPIPFRKVMGSFIGSSCHVFILTKRNSFS
jgi:ubiquinone/menaquinone biosynthesis C-methylase UbiE